MSKELREWIESDVAQFRDKPVSWLSSHNFFRDPVRPVYSDISYFLAPADGVILYQDEVGPDESLVDIKGRPYSLREALRDPCYDSRSIVVGIFMTFFDVHVNRISYPGRLSYWLLDAVDTTNRPMLGVEKSIIDDLRISLDEADYLHQNQRVVNRIDSLQLGQSYFILQVADYDVDSITPFGLRQNWPVAQGRRFSQIRYGSQVDLIVPLSPLWEFLPTQPVHCHVEAGIDTVIEIKERKRRKGAVPSR
ncbi:phosphatidylserine decarboxylase [Streptomyces sp. NK08204]|uniref:phosphatidylserine decarboxylase n=1 Tax=Streptomyces sp. NK08204 TaxID=2873260 RepID=UPI001CEC4F66|nr:phosphatidylserine decarboxylase [Streptomyces sp. NK08204]